jgi:hypothetical protein
MKTVSYAAAFIATFCSSLVAEAQLCHNTACGAGQTIVTFTGSTVAFDVTQGGTGGAIEAISTSTSITGISTTGTGVSGGTTGAGYGVAGSSAGGRGVYGSDSSNGVGGYFTSASGYGVFATSSGSDAAVKGTINATGASGAIVGVGNGYGNAVYGTASGSSYAGVYGTGTTGTGVYGVTSGTDGYGVLGTCSGTGCYGGYFSANVNVTSGNSYYYKGTTGTCIGGACPSDRRLKHNIEPLAASIDKILQLQGVSFEWINADGRSPKGTQTGFIAQEVEKVFPAWVDEGHNGYKAITLPPIEFAALTVESFRAQEKEIADLKARLKAVEDARRPISMNANGLGFGVAGLAIAGALVFNRRRRDEKQ